MEIRFLGGAQQVGSLGMVLKDGSHKVLFDYGMTPSDPPEYPLPIPSGVEYCFLSHCHLDHSGMAPVTTRGPHTQMVTTDLTRIVAELLLTDSMKIAKAERYPEPFTVRELRNWMTRTVGMRKEETFRVGNVEVDLTSAGHVPGAAMYRWKGSRDLLFTGDVHGLPTHLVGGAQPLEADILVMESTYAGREHPDRTEEDERFRKEVETVVSGGGQVIVPAFAVGRTQEILMTLAECNYNIWVDGMGRAVNDMYLDNPSYLRDPKALRRAVESAYIVEEPYDREVAMAEAEVIVTTGGMLDGGPVLGYLKRLHRDPRNALFLVGFQVDGSNGRQLLDNGSITLDEKTLRPKLKVKTFDFSSHAGHSDLVRLAKAVKPKTVVLMHGDHREALAEELRKEFEVILPLNGEPFTV